MSIKHLLVGTCWYLLDPTPIDIYYQCYNKYDEDDDDKTIITLNLKENRCENSGAIACGNILRKLNTLDKNSGGRGGPRAYAT